MLPVKTVSISVKNEHICADGFTWMGTVPREMSSLRKPREEVSEWERHRVVR